MVILGSDGLNTVLKLFSLQVIIVLSMGHSPLVFYASGRFGLHQLVAFGCFLARWGLAAFVGRLMS